MHMWSASHTDAETHQRQSERRYSGHDAVREAEDILNPTRARPRPGVVRRWSGLLAFRLAITAGVLLDLALFAVAYACMGLGGWALALAGPLFVVAMIAALGVALAGFVA